MKKNLVIYKTDNDDTVVFDPNDKTKKDRKHTQRAINAFKNHNKNNSENGMKRKEKLDQEKYGKGIINIKHELGKSRSAVNTLKVHPTKIGSDEHAGAKILKKYKGGYIIVKREELPNDFNIGKKNPDYFIDGKDWDMKKPIKSNLTTLKNSVIDKVIQINYNKGKKELEESL